jgi:hypothetical protein
VEIRSAQATSRARISALLRHEPESDRVLALKGANRGKNQFREPHFGNSFTTSEHMPTLIRRHYSEALRFLLHRTYQLLIAGSPRICPLFSQQRNTTPEWLGVGTSFFRKPRRSSGVEASGVRARRRLEKERRQRPTTTLKFNETIRCILSSFVCIVEASTF